MQVLIRQDLRQEFYMIQIAPDMHIFLQSRNVEILTSHECISAVFFTDGSMLRSDINVQIKRT
jgi:hypothetical protein